MNREVFERELSTLSEATKCLCRHAGALTQDERIELRVAAARLEALAVDAEVAR